MTRYEMNRNVLYRIYDDDGVLLYVGATTNPGHRLRSHSQNQPWWDEAAEIKLERFATRAELAAAETAAIQAQNPRYNVIDSNKTYEWSRQPRAPKGEGTVFQRGDGYWIGRIELPPSGGKRKSRTVGGRTREVAEEKLANLKAELGFP